MENKYTTNEYKFNKISSRFKNVSSLSFYTTQIKIATKEYAKFLNNAESKIVSFNSSAGGQTFAIKKDGEFVVNERLVKQCIKKAKKGQFTTFWFFYVNIVLDELKEALSNRK